MWCGSRDSVPRTEVGGRPVTVDTIFSVQSMSKVFTATAVMQAVQSGQLSLDTPITTYLPGFTVNSAFESHPEQRITLRMLLSHTAGFTHESPLGNNYEPEPGDFDAHVRSISVGDLHSSYLAAPAPRSRGWCRGSVVSTSWPQLFFRQRAPLPVIWTTSSKTCASSSEPGLRTRSNSVHSEFWAV